MAQAIGSLKEMETWNPDTVSSMVTQADINLGKMEACGLPIALDVKETAQRMMEIAQKDLPDEDKLTEMKRTANDLERQIWTMLGKSRGY